MSNDPLALSKILAELPDTADYDHAYAALMVTERGRWFLTESARRIRDTIPHSPTGGAVPDIRLDLIAIAAAIERVTADLVAGEAAAEGGLDAIERIQDVAFVLHERAVEATLCDTLDAAIREISDVYGSSGPAAERAHRAADALGALARRVAELIASSGHAAASPPNRAPVPHSDAGEKPPARPPSSEFPPVPEDNPADRFEQGAHVAPSSGAADPGAHPASVVTVTSSRDAGPPRVPTTPNPTAADALAALRALSEEELIALFT